MEVGASDCLLLLAVLARGHMMSDVAILYRVLTKHRIRFEEPRKAPIAQVLGQLLFRAPPKEYEVPHDLGQQTVDLAL